MTGPLTKGYKNKGEEWGLGVGKLGGGGKRERLVDAWESLSSSGDQKATLATCDPHQAIIFSYEINQQYTQIPTIKPKTLLGPPIVG